MRVSSESRIEGAEVAGVEVWPGHWVGGEPIAGRGETFLDSSPIDSAPLAKLASAGRDEVDAAVAAARRAFPDWAALGAAGRAPILHAFADELRRRSEELAAVECADNGTLLAAARDRFVPRAELNLRFFADWAPRMGAIQPAAGVTHFIRYEPAGVCALITPWNAPLMLTTWKLGPALAAGNTVVIKPPEWAPLSCSLLAEIAAAAGVPAGVVNVVQGIGETTGAALVEHPDIDRLSFTGSVETGRIVGRMAADRIVPASLELGGKSPLIVLDDADLERAAEAVAHQYFNAGQVCLAGTRLLVQRGVAERFLELVRERAGRLVVGDPREPATRIGPLINDGQAARVAGFVERALADGAELLVGDGRLDGRYLHPVLLGNVREDQEVVQEEVFGPVLTWQEFDHDEEAIELANGTRFGLAGGLFTGSRQRAEHLGGAVVTGMLWVNGYGHRDLAAPFGGTRRSGVGREGGNWSFDFFCDVKDVMIADGSFGDDRDG